jgi:serine/threonine-protein kinase
MRLTPGTWITHTVRLVRPLGAGGMSTVWVAADMRLHTQVAVKILSPALLKDETARARFVREGRLPAEIESPYLVHIYEEGELDDSTPFFVMEWLEGETLKQRLKREYRLTPAQAGSVVTQVCRALSKAHAMNVVHRDVKADNIFVLRSEDIIVKLLDFGVAKRPPEDDELAIVTRRGETLGTPSYMSPEQLRHASEVDYRSDLWALGVLAYRMLVGALPFSKPDYPALCLAICEGDFVLPSSYDARWPEALDAWFSRALKLDRDGRFMSADEAAESFHRAIAELPSDLPVGAPPTDDPESMRMWDEADTLPKRPKKSQPPKPETG